MARVISPPGSSVLDWAEPVETENQHLQSIAEKAIVSKLRSFGIDAVVSGRVVGPVVTQYQLTVADGVKVSKVSSLADDLALALAVESVSIRAPVPGESTIGVEVPNTKRSLVRLGSIIDAADESDPLSFTVGVATDGKTYVASLSSMPHLLIAGATGSGKSVMVNSLISTILSRCSPHEVRMVLIDPKQVELTGYNDIPHLLVPVVTDTGLAATALSWLVAEMESRYSRFAMVGARNIQAYNSAQPDEDDQLPYIVVVIDELADLMMTSRKAIEPLIVRIAQKARATGIHMVVATQRPTVNVVTGLIKANFPSRIAFTVASQIDSRVILDGPGAEDLTGRGDMLYQHASMMRPVRLQGGYISDDEINRVVSYWSKASIESYEFPEPITNNNLEKV